MNDALDFLNLDAGANSVIAGTYFLFLRSMLAFCLPPLYTLRNLFSSQLAGHMRFGLNVLLLDKLVA